MLWIGITGSIGTGKSTFSEILRQYRHMVLDADELAKLVLWTNSSGYHKAIAEFGSEIIGPTGHIDRSVLAKLVFGEKANLEKLENIIHPEIRISVDKIREEERRSGRKVLFYDVPLLFEKNMEKTFDLVVMVTCDPETQLKRIRARNKWSEDEIKNRLAAQLPIAEKEARAHVVIDNNGTMAHLKSETKKFLEWLETIS